MSDLRGRFQELADAAAREGHTPGAAAAARRARQRQLRLAGGVASVLVVVLVAGALLVDRIAGEPARPAPLPAVGGTQAGPGGVRTDPPAAGTRERVLLERELWVLTRCRGGGAPELIGWVQAHNFTVMAAAKPPRPGEGWICQVGGYPHPAGSVNVITEPWVSEGRTPPPRKRLAATGGNLGIPADRGTLAYVQGYATRQVARVRLLAEDGRRLRDLALIDPGERFPVRFFLALFTIPSTDDYPFATVEALDRNGRTIARCSAGAPPVGDCRDV